MLTFLKTSSFAYPVSLQKVFRDAWHYRVRTAVVIFTIVIAIFMLGTLYGTWSILSQDLNQSYIDVDPADGLFITQDVFYEDVVNHAGNIPEIAKIEGRFFQTVRIQVAEDKWEVLHLYALPNFENIKLDKITPESGSWPPPEQTILLERSSVKWLWPDQDTDTGVGQDIVLKLQNGKEYTLETSGIVYDIIHPASTLSNNAYGYVSMETLEQLIGTNAYNMIVFSTTKPQPDSDHIQYVSELLKENLEKQNIVILQKELREPGQHPLSSIIRTLLFILGSLGILALILCAILIVNTISTIQASQVKQVGIMKTIGAVPNNVIVIAMGVMVLFGLLAILISTPLVWLGTWALTQFAASLINFRIINFTIPLQVYLLEIIIGLCFPLIIALIPIIKSSRITVRKAIDDTGGQQNEFGVGKLDQWLNKIQHLPIYMRYALRNIFRRKIQLTFVVLVLCVAGAIFIATISLQASLIQTSNNIESYWQQDIRVLFSYPYRSGKVEQVALTIPGITNVEGRISADAFLIDAQGQESKRMISVLGTSPTSEFLKPTLLEGRWLQTGGNQEIVINVNMLEDNPTLSIDDKLILKINGDEIAWEIVGIATSQIIGNAGFMAPIAYVDNDDLAKQVRQSGRINELLVETDTNTLQAHTEIMQALDEQLQRSGLQTYLTHSYITIRTTLDTIIAIPVSLTFIMTLLFASVGGLGLMGMMSLSVIQRTKELGITRAIGSTDIIVAKIIMTEGLIIGLFSWVFSILLSIPLSMFLSNTVGLAFLQSPLTYVFPIYAVFLCLLLILVIALISTLLPAYSAAQLSINESLNYE